MRRPAFDDYSRALESKTNQHAPSPRLRPPRLPPDRIVDARCSFWHRMLRSCRFRLTRDYEARHTFAPFGIASGDVALTLEPIAG